MLLELDYFPLPEGPLPPGVGIVGGWRITSTFGDRPNPFTGVPSWHSGEDIAAPYETRLYAPITGYCAQGWDSTGGGNWTGITDGAGNYIGMGHASRFVAGCNGRVVRAGEHVAYVDSTGASTGNHLHCAYRPAGWGRYADPYDLLQRAADAGRFAAHLGAPVPPGHDQVDVPGDAPQHSPKTPEEILVDLKFWTIKGEPTFYAVGLEPFLSPQAIGRDGQPQAADHFVGGLYCYAFPDPASFTLVAGVGCQPVVLDPAEPSHRPLIDALRSLPLVYQGT